MADSASDLLARESEYLQALEGRAFFLALPAYVAAITGRRRTLRVLKSLERDVEAALRRFVEEQTEFVGAAKSIRDDLASRAPEIDNSDLPRPDPRTQDYARWEYDSLAGFDVLVEQSNRIGYPLVPSERDNPGVVSQLIQILRGRYRAAAFGSDSPPDASPIRDDLDDLARRIGSLNARYTHALTNYRQEARTLPGLAYARIKYFSSNLTPDAIAIETHEQLDQWLDKTLREWGTPKRNVQKLVNHEEMEGWERRSATDVEQFLKGELNRLHQEFMRRISPGSSAAARFLRDQWVVALGSAIVGGLIVGLVLAYGFGIGNNSVKPPPGTMPTIATTP